MPYSIAKRGTKFVVQKADGSKTFGTHDTEEEAKTQLAALNIAEKRSAEVRELHLLGATGQVRTEMIDGKEHLVVPVVMLMEGVIHAVNAETPEFVPFETLKKAAESWNGKPVTLGHPKKDGKQCSAQDEAILASHGIGVLRNVHTEGVKMLGEALVEKARAKRLHPDMYVDLEAGKPIEVSVGAMVLTDKKPGIWQNVKRYMASWLETIGDHLAFLPGGRGACSLEMGCGTHRAAMRVCEDGMELENLAALPDKAEVETEGKMKVGDKVKIHKPGHGAHGKTGTITASKDGKHTVGDHGTFDPSELRTAAAPDDDTTDPEEVAELVAYQTMRDVWDATDQQWDKVSDLINALISDETDDPTETPEAEAAEEQVETARIESIRTHLQAVAGSIQGLISLTYGNALSDGPRYMETLSGARHSKSDMAAIQAVHDHSMALGAQCDRGNFKMLDGDPKLKDFKLKEDERKLSDPRLNYIDRVRREVGR